MSATYGIAGFVDGFIKGKDTRQKWDDRKLDRARQERLDKMDEETHARRLRMWDQQIAATDKAVADQAEMDRIFAESVEAAKTAEAEGASAPEDGAAAGSSSASLPMGVMPLGMPGSRSGQDFTRRAPADKMAADAEAAKLPAVMPLGIPARGPVAAPTTVVEAKAKENARIPTMDAAGAPNKALYDEIERRSAGLGLPSPAMAATVTPTARGEIAKPGGKDDFAKANPDIAAGMDKRAKDRAAALDVENLRREAYEDGPIPLEWRREARAKLDAMGYTTNDGGETLVRKDAGSPRINLGPRADAAPPPKAAPPASASPQVKGMAQTAVDAMAETTTPAMQAAAESASMGLPKASKGGAKSEAARTKYAKGFMDHYAEKGAPMVIEAFLKRGEFDKAMKFQEFLDGAETKAGMDNWAKAAFAASVGDMDGFADNIIEAYNRTGYFSDDTTIVKDESGFTRDKAGNITGARLVFRDEKTGNTFDQVFTDPNDLVRLGITLLAPEQAFEYYHAQQEAAAKAALGIAEKDEKRADKDAAAEAAFQKRVDDVANTIMEQANDPLNQRTDAEGNPLPPLSYAEARAQAEAILRGGGGGGGDGAAAASGPPVAYRPPV